MNGFYQSQQSYQKTKIETASPGELIVMLYDGLIRFLHQAKNKLGEKDIEGCHVAIVKSQNIITELQSSLRTDCGVISQNLQGLYAYMFKRLVEANLTKDSAVLDEIINLVVPMRNTWAEIEKKSNETAKANSPINPTVFDTQR
jgi:flagellar protein FliS